MPSDIGQYFTKINKGLGDSQGQLLQALGSFLGGLAIAFFYGPVISAICFAFIPGFFIVIVCLTGPAKTAVIAKMGAITKLGGYTEESLHALKLIVSFAREEHAIMKYNERAKECYRISNKAGYITAVFYFVFRLGIFGFFIYCYYMASVFVEDAILNPRNDEPYGITTIVSVT